MSISYLFIKKIKLFVLFLIIYIELVRFDKRYKCLFVHEITELALCEAEVALQIEENHERLVKPKLKPKVYYFPKGITLISCRRTINVGIEDDSPFFISACAAVCRIEVQVVFAEGILFQSIHFFKVKHLTSKSICEGLFINTSAFIIYVFFPFEANILSQLVLILI